MTLIWCQLGCAIPTFYTWNRLRRALEIANLLSDSEKRKSALAVARELADALARTDKFALWIEIIKLLAGYSNEMHEGNKYAEQIWQRASEFEQKMGFQFFRSLYGRCNFPVQTVGEQGSSG